MSKAYVQVLPLALAAIYLLPALAFMCGAVAWEGVRTLLGKWRRISRRRGG